MYKTMRSMTIKKTNKKSRKKERRKRGKTMEEGRKKLDLLHPLGIARYFSPPLLRKFQGGFFFTNSSSSSLKLHGKNNNRK
jgi:hypothetical protein